LSVEKGCESGRSRPVQRIVGEYKGEMETRKPKKCVPFFFFWLYYILTSLPLYLYKLGSVGKVEGVDGGILTNLSVGLTKIFQAPVESAGTKEIATNTYFL
jgi:hypothetical protein